MQFKTREIQNNYSEAKVYLVAYFHGEAATKAKKPLQIFLRKIQFPNETYHLQHLSEGEK